MSSSAMLHLEELVRTDVSEEHLHQQGDKNRRARNNVSSNQQPKHGARRFLQQSHGVTSPETAFFIVTAVKISNLT
jgi:hypothetical protein